MEVAELVVASVSLMVAAVALWVASLALKRADKSSSAANLIAINEGLRQAWSRFLPTPLVDKDYEFAELCNALEIACAIWTDKAFHGSPKRVIEQLLNEQLDLIAGNAEASRRLSALQDKSTTFEYLRRFLDEKQL